jgi:subtilisin family serine protease
VAGIAAGSGAGSPGKRYAGVAPGADLAVVKTTFDTGDIARAVAYLFEFAAQRDQPCVVNLSLGGHFGGHDGSTVLERTIDELCDARHGRVVVASAGNEGGARIHAGTVLERKPDARWAADFQLNPVATRDGDFMGLVWMQVWTHWEDDIRLSLRAPNGETFRCPSLREVGDPFHREVDREVFVIDVTYQVAPYSRDLVATLGLSTVADPRWLRGWSIIAEAPGDLDDLKVGTVHAWIQDDTMGEFTTNSTRSHLVGMPGTAFSAVTVGSYATRRDLPARRFDAVNLEDFSYFSSPGPTREAQNKPEVAGPGQWVIAPLSKDALPAEVPSWARVSAKYAAMQGTSMSAPYVTGAVALLLEKYPRLHWAEVKRRLIKSVRQDRFSTACWNQRWGYGKIDVERLLTIEPTPWP